jgi:hypothetical protein
MDFQYVGLYRHCSPMKHSTVDRSIEEPKLTRHSPELHIRTDEGSPDGSVVDAVSQHEGQIHEFTQLQRSSRGLRR